MVDFNKLRANKGNQFAAMQKKLEATEKGGFAKDPRIWKPVANQEGKFDGVIRFLSISKADYQLVEDGKANAEDLTPLAKILSHQFQGPHGWFIEKSLQTFGEKCPVREHDGPKWGDLKKRGVTEGPEKDELKKRLPKTTYYANIEVVKDSTNPENNGKVFIYEFGETVRKLIEAAKNPEFEGDPSIDAFNMWEGAPLLLRLTYEKKKFNNKEVLVPDFKNAKFGNVAPAGSDERIEELWTKAYALQEFYDRKHFKTYEQLEEKFNKVMGITGDKEVARPGSTLGKTAENFVQDAPIAEAASAPVSESKPLPVSQAASDDMSEFEAMLNS
ncbi:hypothetical protein [Ralstonia phage RSP15]|uniref:single strand DNA binding protein n=1 Tax=Ralstonia phage RSP15 TaxID=1785960 RepID=UPI00074D296F|nr:single strand DNA binding protein [Ralstonia phage RSP15]BAU40095.1 hypothetical protein [Ralstonia phage RSP15]